MNRYRDALAIIDPGACNPVAVACTIYERGAEMYAEHKSTDEVENDPAMRLMVHQLASLMNVENVSLAEYGNMVKECLKLAGDGSNAHNGDQKI